MMLRLNKVASVKRDRMIDLIWADGKSLNHIKMYIKVLKLVMDGNQNYLLHQTKTTFNIHVFGLVEPLVADTI